MPVFADTVFESGLKEQNSFPDLGQAKEFAKVQSMRRHVESVVVRVINTHCNPSLSYQKTFMNGDGL